MPDAAIRQVVEFAIGGGWGQEVEFEDSVLVRVIRGTDFERIRKRDYAGVPRRYEKTSKVERRLLRPGDIILEISGGSRTSNQSTGRTFLVSEDVLDELGEPAIPASFCRLVRFSRDAIDAQYAYYLLQEMYLSGRAALYEQQSTGISNFQFEYFLDSEVVPLPPLEEQRAIARVLGALDDRIELNRRMSETLEEMARALFRSWFVDFDPVRAKAEGRPSGLPPDLDALFPASFEASELGEIPAGWEVIPAGEAMTVYGGSTPSTKEPSYWGGEHCFATPKDLATLQEPILASTARHLTDAGVARIRSGLLPPGTVLLSSRAPIGYLAVTETPVGINQGIVAMACDGLVGAFYALHWTRSNMHAIETRAGGTTFAEISKSSFREIPFLVPPQSTDTAWQSLVSPLYDLVSSCARQSRVLTEQRDALLPRLVSGVVRVGHLDTVGS